MTEPTETKSISRRAASIGRRETERKNGLATSPPVKYYWTVSGKSKRLQEYLQLLFSTHTLLHYNINRATKAVLGELLQAFTYAKV